jgi:hypothetical protein
MKNRFTLAALALAVLAGTASYAKAQDYDRDDYRYQRGYQYDRYDHGRENFRRGMNVAREVGYRDGAETARGDMWHRKPYNPNPRGRYDDADHGYRSEFGDRHEYREHYTEAYREGYMSAFRNGRYGNW